MTAPPLPIAAVPSLLLPPLPLLPLLPLLSPPPLPYVVLQRLCTLCLPSKVSAVLTEAAVVLPQDEYVKLLNQHVLPGVDDAACRDVVQQAISDFKAKDDVDQMVNFAGHQASLCGQAKELKRSLRQDCHSWVACSWLLPRSAWFSLKARLLTTRQL